MIARKTDQENEQNHDHNASRCGGQNAASAWLRNQGGGTKSQAHRAFSREKNKTGGVAPTGLVLTYKRFNEVVQ
jgi:hypothetical protein